jgi:hypothetical protein
MDAMTGQSVQEYGKNRHQGFAFTGGQFGNAAMMQDDATGQLHIEGTQVQKTPTGDTGRAERFGQQTVQRLTAASSTAKLQPKLEEVRIRQPTTLFFPMTDVVYLQRRLRQAALRWHTQRGSETIAPPGAETTQRLMTRHI